jgi:hypothetical protein
MREIGARKALAFSFLFQISLSLLLQDVAAIIYSLFQWGKRLGAK